MPSTIVVDDESDIRLMIRLVLETSGDYVVIAEASDGDEAVEAVRASLPSEPDVVLLDNRMPRLSGLEAARAILAERPDTRIVLFSAFLDDHVRAEADEIGITAVLSKANVNDLPELLRSCLAD